MTPGPRTGPRPVFRLPWRSARQIRSDFEDEISFHCEMRVAELVGRGMSERDARVQVASEAGDLADAKRYVNATDAATERAHLRRMSMQHITQEIGQAVRRLRHERAFALTAVSTLALGLGACMLMFNIVDAVLLSPLPFRQPDRVVMIWQYVPSLGAGDALQPIGGRQLAIMRENLPSFESIAGFRARPMNLGDEASAERIDAIEATGDFFAALGVRPELGHFFSRADEIPAGTRPAVLSDALWRRRFGADTHVIGRVISLNSEPYVVAGVAPPGFAFPRGAELPPTFQFPSRAELWVPIAPPNGGPEDMAVTGRLRPGAAIDRARVELNHVTEMMLKIYPQAKGFFGTEAIPIREQLVGQSEQLLLSLLAAVSLLLLIACVNTAQLQLAQLQRRRRDLAVRGALGAPAWRLLFGSVVEVLAVAVLAGTVGTALALFGFRILRAQLADKFPLLAGAPFDFRTIVVALLVTIAVGLAAGVGPSLFGLRIPLIETLRRGGRGTGGGAGPERLRRALIIVEVSMAVVLVAMAGLMGKSLVQQLGTELGFKVPNGLTFEITLPRNRYPERQGPTYMEHAAAARFIADALDHIRAIPGVGAAAVGKPLPLSGSQEWTVFAAENHPQPENGPIIGADYTVASADMFRALGTPIIEGRDFNSTDREDGVPVVIVNQSMAKWMWPGESGIGKRIKLGRATSKTPWMLVVGVTADMRRYALTDSTRPEMIVPYTQNPYPTFSTLQFVVRSALPAEHLTSEVQRAVSQVDPTIPVSRVRTIGDLVSESSTSARFAARLMTAFGASALFLAMIGLYGVVAYGVLQRRQEFGLRRALGASSVQIVGLVAREASVLTSAGIAIGTLVALGAGFAIRSLLYGVASYDVPTLVGTIAVLSAAGLVAAVAPAWRAAQVEPRTALEEP
jgi:putative ABC transport system permease protein